MVLLLRKRHLLTVVAAVALCGALLLTARPGAAAVSWYRSVTKRAMRWPW